LLFLLTSLLPFLGLTIVASRRLSQSIDVWQSPGTKRALESSLVLARKSLSKYEADLRSLSPRLVGDRRLLPLLKAQRWTDVEYLLASELEPLAVDFLQVYEEKDNTWHLLAQAADTGVTAPGAFSDELMRRALESNDVLRSEAGYVALPLGIEGAQGIAVAVGTSGGTSGTGTDAQNATGIGTGAHTPGAGGGAKDTAGGVGGGVEDAARNTKPARFILVAGYWLGEDFFTNVREVTDALVYYGQLEIYKRVAKQSVWVTGAILFGAALVGSLLIAALLARQLSRPILGLTEGMKRVAAGRLDEKVVVNAGGEIRYLVDSFNQMTQDLRVYKEQLARAERIAAWQDIARYVAHEIRNPLTPIKISLHRLRTCLAHLNEEEKRRFSDSLDSMLGEVSSLERLATTFSEFAKLPEPIPAPIDINKIIKEITELYQSPQENSRAAAVQGEQEGEATLAEEGRQEVSQVSAQAGAQEGAEEGAREDTSKVQLGIPQIRFDLSLDASLPIVYADPQQIRMAFLNIVKNAVEAMPRGGTLQISSGRASDIETRSLSGTLSGERAVEFVEIAFKDTGCGIPDAVIGKVMTPHFTTKKGGTGLGLAVVSKVISQHCGRVFIQSREAKGTLVRIVLPTQGSGVRTIS